MAGISFTAGSGINDSIFGKSQQPIRMILEKRAQAFEEKSVVDMLFKKDKVGGWAAKYTSMTSMQGFKPVPENGSTPRDTFREGYSKVIEPVEWKDSFSVSRKMVDDKTSGLDLSKKPAAFIQGFGSTKEQYGAALLAGGMRGDTINFRGMTFSTTASDGQALFSETHPSITGGQSAQCNKYSNVFSREALNKLECKAHDFRDDNGNICNIAPDTIVVCNDAALIDAVFQAVGSNYEPGSGNGFNYQCGRWKVVIWPYLNQFKADAAPYFLVDSSYNDIVGTFMWADRVPLEVKSYVDENTDENIWKGYARFSAGFVDWRGVIGGGMNSSKEA